MIDEPLVEHSSPNRCSKGRVGEKPNVLEETLNPKKVLKRINVEPFTREIDFVPFS